MRADISNHVLLVFLGQSKLEHYENGKLVRTYTVSTGKNPSSAKEGSNGTPPGLHVVCEKIGAGEPIDTVFVSRMSIGHTWRELKAAGEPAEKARVTSRILRLKGLETGVNSGPGIDSYERYIYFHGTVFEDRIGEPTSAGCITLVNREMIELFDSVPVGTLVYIKA